MSTPYTNRYAQTEKVSHGKEFNLWGVRSEDGRSSNFNFYAEGNAVWAIHWPRDKDDQGNPINRPVKARVGRLAEWSLMKEAMYTALKNKEEFEAVLYRMDYSTSPAERIPAMKLKLGRNEKGFVALNVQGSGRKSDSYEFTGPSMLSIIVAGSEVSDPALSESSFRHFMEVSFAALKHDIHVGNIDEAEAKEKADRDREARNQERLGGTASSSFDDDVPM